MCIMRTTVNIDEHLLAAAKDRAQEQGVTLGSVLEEAIQRLLAAPAAAAAPPEIPVFKGSGANPAIDWTSNAAIEEFLDAADGPAPGEKLGKW
jgi:hypothetical protein